MSATERVAWSAQGYAGFWQRVGGYLVDALLFAAVAMVVGLVVGLAGGAAGQDATALVEEGSGWLQLLLGVAYFVYDTVLTSRRGATLGKRAAGIEVRRPDGTLPSYGVAVGRYFARWLSAIPLGLGFLWAAFEPRKRTWHDLLASTVVVRRAAMLPAHAAAPQAEGSARWWSGEPPHPAPAGAEPPVPSRAEPPAAAGGPRGATLESASWGPAGLETAPAASGPDRDDHGDPEAHGEREPHRDPEVHRDEVHRHPQAHRDTGPPTEPGPLPPAVPPAADPNRVAVERAGLSREAAAWVRRIAEQVDPRLDRVGPAWRRAPQAEAARACAFGILLGHLARVHPHMAGDLSRVAEAHPSFSTLLAGSRLATLEQIAAEPARSAAWLGPLIDVEEPERIARLLA